MNSHQIINLAHILILGPFLLAVGTGYIPPSKYIAGIGIVIALYHVFKMSQKGVNWVNMFHTVVVGPALIAYGVGAPGYVRELILMLGIAAIGYHAYYMVAA
jgi:hypothetical protein